LGCFQKLPRSFTNDCLPYVLFSFVGCIKPELSCFHISAVTTLDFCQTRGLDRERKINWCISNVVRGLRNQQSQTVASRYFIPWNWENNHALTNSHPSSQG
jgi:hypothetical protein